MSDFRRWNGGNASFSTLIPKLDNSMNLNEYRLILLISGKYVVAKVLSRHYNIYCFTEVIYKHINMI